MSKKKELYEQLCNDEPSIPIFSQYWWLDATADNQQWDVALVEKQGVVMASMPYLIGRKAGLKVSTVPPLTYCLGPWLRPTAAKAAHQLSRQKELFETLIEQLPAFDHFRQQWHYNQTNWLPFFWHGYSQTTQYTYLLPLQEHEDVTWRGLQENIRREVRKASGRAGLRVRDDLSIQDFLPLNRLVFQRQGITAPYTEGFIDRLDQACAHRRQRKIFMAEDKQGILHAGVYLVWDKHSAYYLMGGGDPDRRNSGGMSLCMWEAIKFASTVTKRFDFCGSMIQPVERFVRAFGGVQTPYFTVSKTPSRLASAYLFARSHVLLSRARK
jgi:hypothetical protein